LQHPFIATFYEAGEEEGEAFVAMEYVRGRTLRDTLRDGALPPDQAIAVAAALLEALAHAHAARVLHRDVKPENVMLAADGRVKLLDFGLAKSLAPEDEGADKATLTLLTAAGAITGTPGYLAPEQLRGDPVDGRTDLFAVGAVLLEMLTGAPAFPGATPMARMAATLSPEPERVAVAGAPAGMDEVLARALARDPAERYGGAGEFLADLRGLQEGRGVAPGGGRLAIFDFENLSGDPGDDWIGSGMAESLAADLGRRPGLDLVAREKALQARRGATHPDDPLALGLRLGCRWVIAGSCQRVGPALRVTCRVAEAATGRVLASGKIDGTLEKVFELQDRLAAVVAPALDLRQPAAARHGPAAAWEAYARGRRLQARLGKGSLDEARRQFEEAVAIDPAHAGALAGLAMAHALKFTFTTDPDDLVVAGEYARRAVAADPNHAEARVWLGYALMRQGRSAEALAELRLAMEGDPHGYFAPYFAACSASNAVRRDEALVLYQKAITAEPNYNFAWIGLGWTHMDLGRLEEARYCFARAEDLERVADVHVLAGVAGYLGEALRRMNRLDEARAACARGLAAVEGSDHMYRDTIRAICLLALGRTAFRQGDTAAARAAFSQGTEHLRGRARALGGGHYLVQMLAGMTRATGDPAPFEEARALFENRRGHDFSWFWGASDDASLIELARAARALGRAGESVALLRRAADAGAAPDTSGRGRGAAAGDEA
jgi:TolB-like protein/cytochrome c-type biogenesis protein CcmH/NrfG